jgi:hypothetical protein
VFGPCNYVLGIRCPDGRTLVLYYGKSIALRMRYQVRRSGALSDGHAAARGGKTAIASMSREARSRGGKTSGGKNLTQAGRSRGGKAKAAKAAAAKAAAAVVAELEAEGRAMDGSLQGV